MQESWEQIRKSALVENTWKWVVLIILMLVNWGIEAQKWHLSIKHLQPITFLRSFRAILTGLSFAVNTPNRTGEYIGRVLYVKDGNRIKAIAVTFINSWSQLIITLVMGVLALFYMQWFMDKATLQQIGLSLFWIRAIEWVFIGITFVAFAIYFRLNWLIPLIEKIPFVGKYSHYFNVLGEFTRKELLWMLLLSFIRYLVFIAQYQLVFSIFEVDVSWWQGFWMTSAIFLVLAIVPTIALAELGLRGEVSLQLLGMVSLNKIGIVASSATIWLVNLILPAIVGSILVIGIKIYRNK